jgi:hypothetical protein
VAWPVEREEGVRSKEMRRGNVLVEPGAFAGSRLGRSPRLAASLAAATHV